MPEETKAVDINELVPRLLQALEGLTSKIDEMDSRINELDSVIYDGLIGPANDAIAQNEYDSALSDFRTKYSEKLGPYESAVKSVEGDDFDMYKAAFDGYNEGGFEMNPDEYVDLMAEKLQNQIAQIKEAVADKQGISPEEVEVEVDAKDGTVDVAVDDKTTEEKPTTEEPTTEDDSEAFQKKIEEEMKGIDRTIRM